MLAYLIFAVSEIANWFIFIKMNHEGWEGIIPLYNTYKMFEDFYGNGWKCLLLLIPFYNLYIAIKFDIDLAKAFGQKPAFAIGLVLLAPVFMCILAFDKNIYYHGIQN